MRDGTPWGRIAIFIVFAAGAAMYEPGFARSNGWDIFSCLLLGLVVGYWLGLESFRTVA